MKKINIVLVVFIVLLLSNCNLPQPSITTIGSSLQSTPFTVPTDEPAPQPVSSSSHTSITINESPDKYTAYVKDYVGKNCATIGYESLGGDRNDHYLHAYIRLVMFTADGEYPGLSNDELKDYVVVAQNIEPNTEIKFTYEKKSDGEEYDNLIEWQSINEIVLQIAKVGSADSVSDKGLTSIKPSPDKYTAYIRDYIGKNCAMLGYKSLGGDRLDHYLEGVVELQMITENGTYIGVSDDELKDYVVVGQNIEPNTEIKFIYKKKSDGEEYDNLLEWQNIKEIVLKIAKIGSADAVSGLLKSDLRLSI